MMILKGENIKAGDMRNYVEAGRQSQRDQLSTHLFGGFSLFCQPTKSMAWPINVWTHKKK